MLDNIMGNIEKALIFDYIISPNAGVIPQDFHANYFTTTGI